jgi:NAD(P)-dependent dehydrogenase (short-subunit alcohol dehydrogenase family)
MFHVKHHKEVLMENTTEFRRVVITGAGRGIGRTLALGFASKSTEVVVHYAHSQQGARKVVEEIHAHGGMATTIQADLSDPEEIADFTKNIHDELGEIDVWINNAGASANSKETKRLSEIQLFNRVMSLDVMGAWQCCRRVEPYMSDNGCILNIGWDGALYGLPGLTSQLYAMSKGAIMSLTRTLAAEYAPRVRVNCIAPGWVENEWSSSLPESSRQRKVERVPLKRWGTSDDVLGAALFLASPAASYITGQTILVNGGEYMQ